MDILAIALDVLHYAPQVVTIASAISAITPVPKKTHKILYILSSILNILALNVGEARKTGILPEPTTSTKN